MTIRSWFSSRAAAPLSYATVNEDVSLANNFASELGSSTRSTKGIGTLVALLQSQHPIRTFLAKNTLLHQSERKDFNNQFN